MLSRQAKSVFYAVAGPVMAANGWRHRHLRRWDQPLRMHLGPGQRNYIEGWVNVDANAFTARCDVWADLRNSLPFPDGVAEAAYSHHVIEHLPDLAGHFREVFRCLRPGGLYRVGGPNGDSAIAKFAQGDAAWFDSFPDDRSSLGGRLENFIFCRGEHLTLLTFSWLQELLTTAGFHEPRACRPVTETSAPEIFTPCLAFEHESDPAWPHTLIIEARKP